MEANAESKSDKKRFNYMENMLQQINVKISVDDEDRKRNNGILNSALEMVLAKFREISPLFSSLYQRTFYGGSFYDQLKTDSPNEYDIDLLLQLSKYVNLNVIPIKEAPGYVELRYTSTTIGSNEWSELFDGEHLCTKKVLTWMEGLVTRAMREFPQSGKQAELTIKDHTFLVLIRKSGPAFTMNLNGLYEGKDLNFDVDLVPCFLLNESKWPQVGFRRNPAKDKTEFFVVPKQPKGEKLPCAANVCWRLSFQEQERQVIHGRRALKPCIRLMKKMRDKLQQTSISSYFIKTIFLWEIEKRDSTFWDGSLSYVFVEMLRAYFNCLRERNIPYYWNRSNNLIGGLLGTMVDNYANRISNILAKIDKGSDPLIIGKFYLTDSELEAFAQVTTSKKEEIGNGSMTSDDSAEVQVTLKNSSSSCNCAAATAQLDAAMCQLRKEIAEVRNEQEINKVEILNLLRVVVKRLDEMDTKLTK